MSSSRLSSTSKITFSFGGLKTKVSEPTRKIITMKVSDSVEIRVIHPTRKLGVDKYYFKLYQNNEEVGSLRALLDNAKFPGVFEDLKTFIQWSKQYQGYTPAFEMIHAIELHKEGKLPIVSEYHKLQKKDVPEPERKVTILSVSDSVKIRISHPVPTANVRPYWKFVDENFVFELYQDKCVISQFRMYIPDSNSEFKKSLKDLDSIMRFLIKDSGGSSRSLLEAINQHQNGTLPTLNDFKVSEQEFYRTYGRGP